jgi:hypothetical protein
MDWTAIVSVIVTGIIGIGAVSVFLKKYMPAVAKWAMIAKDATETLADLADALKDGALTSAEIEKLKADIVHFQSLLKA